MSSLFQLALLLGNIHYVAKKSNIAHTTFRRHYLRWLTLSQPSKYILDETRGRESCLTQTQQEKLFVDISMLIQKKQFVNDTVLKIMIKKMFNVVIKSSSFARTMSWKKRLN